MKLKDLWLGNVYLDVLRKYIELNDMDQNFPGLMGCDIIYLKNGDDIKASYEKKKIHFSYIYYFAKNLYVSVDLNYDDIDNCTVRDTNDGDKVNLASVHKLFKILHRFNSGLEPITSRTTYLGKHPLYETGKYTLKSFISKFKQHHKDIGYYKEKITINNTVYQYNQQIEIHGEYYWVKAILEDSQEAYLSLGYSKSEALTISVHIYDYSETGQKNEYGSHNISDKWLDKYTIFEKMIRDLQQYNQ